MYGFYIDEDRRKARRAKWNTVRIISIGFFGVILLGSLLLWLPFSNHQPIRYIDALFTAVTCVCVTGLVTVVPAAQFTVAGKVILLILIQIGGLGIIACTTAFLILVGKRINMKERVVIQEAYGLSTLLFLPHSGYQTSESSVSPDKEPSYNIQVSVQRYHGLPVLFPELEEGN